jgi:hypothetical protein
MANIFVLVDGSKNKRGLKMEDEILGFYNDDRTKINPKLVPLGKK